MLWAVAAVVLLPFAYVIIRTAILNQDPRQKALAETILSAARAADNRDVDIHPVIMTMIRLYPDLTMRRRFKKLGHALSMVKPVLSAEMNARMREACYDAEPYLIRDADAGFL